MVPPLGVPAAGLLPPGWPPRFCPAVRLPGGRGCTKKVLLFNSSRWSPLNKTTFLCSLVRGRGGLCAGVVRWRVRLLAGPRPASRRRLPGGFGPLAPPSHADANRRQSRRAPALVLCGPPARSSVPLSPLCGPPLRRRGGPCSVRAGRGPRWCGCLSALTVPSRRRNANRHAYRATLGRRPGKVIPPAEAVAITSPGLFFGAKSADFGRFLVEQMYQQRMGKCRHGYGTCRKWRSDRHDQRRRTAKNAGEAPRPCTRAPPRREKI